MTKTLIILIILAFVAGGAAGFYYGNQLGEQKATKSLTNLQKAFSGSSAGQTTETDAKTEECLKQALGESRYNEITKDPKVVTAADQFKALHCYK